ncbi:MAG TPA: IS110 family transposase [Propionibacteriaceae bacterium]|nr:IS110 family transposase [Propionibacteriaceae bacterium]HBY24026.1 IS110 family transposase [Propionibacteriaceae bacterium]
MVVVGVDVHKRTHTFVVVDQVGAKLGHRTCAATTAGHEQAVRWVREQFGTEVVWAVEDCRGLSGRLERDLLAAGQRVVRVAPRLMAGQRRVDRAPGKSDPIDALAVARVALREPDLPVAAHDEVSRDVKLLTDRLDDLVKQRTATINKFLNRVHEIDPSWSPPAGSMDRPLWQRKLAAQLVDVPGVLAEVARDELADIARDTVEINDLERRISNLIGPLVPTLLAMPGVGALTAAKIVGETAGITRFKSEAAFARHAGIAPIPVWSGNTTGRVRVHRGGNRQLNAAIHRIALTQIRLDGPGKTYYEKKKAEGKTWREALRCLKRQLVGVVYRHLHTDHETAAQTVLPAAA